MWCCIANLKSLLQRYIHKTYESLHTYYISALLLPHYCTTVRTVRPTFISCFRWKNSSSSTESYPQLPEPSSVLPLQMKFWETNSEIFQNRTHNSEDWVIIFQQLLEELPGMDTNLWYWDSIYITHNSIFWSPDPSRTIGCFTGSRPWSNWK